MLLLFLASPVTTVIASNTPSIISGTVVLAHPTTFIVVGVKGALTYYTWADVFSFSGDMSGTCTGSESGFFGIGPGGNYGDFIAQCIFTGTIHGVPGTMQISLKSPTGAEFQGNNLHYFSFVGDQGTSGLAGASIRNGQVDSSNQYTANVQPL